MNNLDKQYTDLLQDILNNGVTKQDRTGTGTISVFGRQIRHKMSEGFPLLTTKKMFFKGIVTELLWFLRGDTNIKFLVDNDTSIWNGDAYKNYEKAFNEGKVGGLSPMMKGVPDEIIPKDLFIEMIKNCDELGSQEFAKKWGELGPIYGKQWRNFNHPTNEFEGYDGIDQIANLINELKTNPDSRRLMVNTWNVGELDQMVLPPCHYGFQVYTRELSLEERRKLANQNQNDIHFGEFVSPIIVEHWDRINIPTRAISLMWNQRSVDTFLGLPFNIASYGLLLEIIAKAVNMVPDELIGNLGDVHLYSNHIEQAKEQIGRELSIEERTKLLADKSDNKKDFYDRNGRLIIEDDSVLNASKIPKRTREPYPLPSLNINIEFWPYEKECGLGPIDANAVFQSFHDDHFCRCLIESDIQLGNYQSHPAIKAPLSN